MNTHMLGDCQCGDILTKQTAESILKIGISNGYVFD